MLPPPVVTSVPAQLELAPLATWPTLEARLHEWDAAIRSPLVSAASMRAVYGDHVRFRKSRLINGDLHWLSDYWGAEFGRNGGTFDVDWAHSQWRLEALADAVRNNAGPCAQLPGAADGVALVRLAAVENDPMRYVHAGESLPCARLAGIYLIRMVAAPGRGPLICHETWSMQEGVCAPGSCPEAPGCQTPDR